MREGDWKLIRTFKPVRNVKPGESADILTLVNLAEEHPETINHLDQHSVIAARLKELHQHWVANVMPAR